MWVLGDGTVIKQEMTFFNSMLRFVRLPPDVSEDLASHLGEEWNGEISYAEAKQMLDQLVD